MPVNSSTVPTAAPEKKNLAEEQCTTTSKSNLLRDHGTVLVPTVCRGWKQQHCSLLCLSRVGVLEVLSLADAFSNEPLDVF